MLLRARAGSGPSGSLDGSGEVGLFLRAERPDALFWVKRMDLERPPIDEETQQVTGAFWENFLRLPPGDGTYRALNQQTEAYQVTERVYQQMERWRGRYVGPSNQRITERCCEALVELAREGSRRLRNQPSPVVCGTVVGRAPLPPPDDACPQMSPGEAIPYEAASRVAQTLRKLDRPGSPPPVTVRPDDEASGRSSWKPTHSGGRQPAEMMR